MTNQEKPLKENIIVKNKSTTTPDDILKLSSKLDVKDINEMQQDIFPKKTVKVSFLNFKARFNETWIV